MSAAIDVYRIGDLHFVRDGHYRVSIAIATGQKTIEGYVTYVITSILADGIRRRGDLLIKSYERIFRARVPLPPAAQAGTGSCAPTNGVTTSSSGSGPRSASRRPFPRGPGRLGANGRAHREESACLSGGRGRWRRDGGACLQR